MVGMLRGSYGHVQSSPGSVILAERSRKSQVQFPHVPNFAAVDHPGGTDTAILPQFVKLACRDSKIDRSLFP